jgi:hypothetical protein
MQIITNFIKRFWIILAVIALYFLLAGLNWLPSGINIFKKKKLLIDNTPVIVKEIREISELTTSEFYGEVYTDINEVYDDVINKFKDSIAINPAAFYKNYSGLKDYMSKAETFRLKEIEARAAKDHYNVLLNDHIKKLESFTDNNKKLNDQMASLSDDRKEKKALKDKVDELKKNLETEKSSFLDAQKKYVDMGNAFNKQKEDFWQAKKNRNLVYIGRGWVKAGIDLKQLTENDIIIDEGDSSTIQILVPDPIVLDADINPWFIYTDKKQIKGFEVFIAKTGSILSEDNFTDYEVTELKHQCKAKLKQDAIDKGLLKNAKSSAIHTLENLFRMLGFQKVEVHFKSNTIVETTMK